MQSPQSPMDMDIDEVITVTKLKIQSNFQETGYLMIGWQADSFEMYLYLNDKIWKGKFSPNRMAGFSRNLQMDEATYFKTIKRCLSENHDDFIYELKSGFFYWKRKLRNSFLIQGFLPIEIDTSAKQSQPDLLEVLLAINKQLKVKCSNMENKFKAIKADYQKCLKDTEEFLDLKIEMEKSLCEKFINLLHLQKTKVETANVEI